MGWRIISGGQDKNTQIRNTETGQLFPLEDCTEIVWRCLPGRPAELVVTFSPVEIQAVTDEMFQEEILGIETTKIGAQNVGSRNADDGQGRSDQGVAAVPEGIPS